ncbi:hypothetical protein ACFL6D_03035 [Spirochaetota bacterium]
MRSIIVLILILTLFNNCSKYNQTEKLKQQAMINYKNSKIIANKWLNELDKNGYKYYTIKQLPDSFKTVWKEEELLNWANDRENNFGKVNERIFGLVHMLFDKNNLFSYIPKIDNKTISKYKLSKNITNEFVQLKSKIFISKILKWYDFFPKGEYIMLIFSVKTIKKSNAQEQITLWLYNNKWQVVNYNIADDI